MVTNVVDGDTIDAMVTRDLGFNGQVVFPVRLRLTGINAPKLASERGRAARDRVVDLVGERKVVHITTFKPYKYGGPASSSGQYMAQVVLAGGGDLAETLVAEGLVARWDGQGARPDDE